MSASRVPWGRGTFVVGYPWVTLKFETHDCQKTYISTKANALKLFFSTWLFFIFPGYPEGRVPLGYPASKVPCPQGTLGGPTGVLKGYPIARVPWWQGTSRARYPDSNVPRPQGTLRAGYPRAPCPRGTSCTRYSEGTLGAGYLHFKVP
jgi:hypothetical protein